MDEARELNEFLPISFKAPNEQEYISFLWGAFDTNYENERYQFSFLAYHMLMMSFVYFIIWQIREIRMEDFKKALIGFSGDNEKCLLGDSSPFECSLVSERAIFRLLKLIECGNEKIGAYMALVKVRNDVAHSNGSVIFRNRESLDSKITEVLRIANEIQGYHKAVIEQHYCEFLRQSTDPNVREHLDPDDHLREVLIKGGYLSRRDVADCLNFDICILQDLGGFDQISMLHDCLRNISETESYY